MAVTLGAYVAARTVYIVYLQCMKPQIIDSAAIHLCDRLASTVVFRIDCSDSEFH